MRRCFLFLSCLFLMTLLCPLSASAKSGHLTHDDFSYRGVALGASEEELLEKFSKPLYDTDKIIMGTPVKVYSFDEHLKVGVSKRTHRVVDFTISNDNFSIRGVRRGATIFWIEKTFGRTAMEKLDGKAAYVYRRSSLTYDEGDRAKLVLYIDPETRVLDSIRLTSLPVTEEDADKAADEDVLEDETGDHATGKIDMSSLPKEKDVRLGGLF